MEPFRRATDGKRLRFVGFCTQPLRATVIVCLRILTTGRLLADRITQSYILHSKRGWDKGPKFAGRLRRAAQSQAGAAFIPWTDRREASHN